MPHRLTRQQVEQYQQDGYTLFHKPVFGQGKFDQLKKLFEQKLARWTAEGLTAEGMDVPHFSDPALFEWLFADEILDLVEPLIGPDIALWSSHFICKPAGVGKRVPWHEDSGYWGKVLDPMEVVTVWLALDPATPENGCLRVIPGTHHDGYSKYKPVDDPKEAVFGSEIAPGNFDETKAKDCVLSPNQCSLHHAKLIHGSNPNGSDIRRCGYTMRYVPASSKFKPDGFLKDASFQIYLARGQDRAGNIYGDPTKPNEAWINASDDQRLKAKSLA